MSDESKFSRTKLLSASTAGAGAYLMSKVPGRSRLGMSEAEAQTAEKPALLVIFLRGGYNSLFSSADSFLAKGSFGVSTNTVSMLGNGLAVDKASLGSLPAIALKSMATIGVSNTPSTHAPARAASFTYTNNTAFHIALGAAMPGSGPIPVACVGQQPPDGTNATYKGVSLQVITDMASAISAFGGSATGMVNPNLPTRPLSAQVLTDAKSISSVTMASNPNSLPRFSDNYDTAIQLLKDPVQNISMSNLTTAYGLTGGTAITDFKSQMAAAELMILGGSRVVTAISAAVRWDTHGDTTGNTARNIMNTTIIPGLKIFLTRMMADPTRNVVTMMFAEFARSLPGSNHQTNMSATVIGKYVKQGTTGHVDANVGLPTSGPPMAGLWAFAAAAHKTPTSPFGANPHPLIL